MAAVKVSEFFEKYHANAVAFFMVIQSLAAILLAIISYMVWNFTNLENLTTFAICVVIFMLVQLVLTYILIGIMEKPLKVLSQAVAHVSNDSVQTPPPAINSTEYERSGLKAMVQTVYELAVKSHQADENANQVIYNPLDNIFDNSPCGIIALDKSGQVIAANQKAPAHLDSNNNTVLELIFEKNIGLVDWLEYSRLNKVRDTHTWHRVANKVQGEADRRVFDVIGYYSKDDNQGIEVILITIDRTAEYVPEEEDMDFLALAAHELRGPITVIRGYLDIIADELQTVLQPDQQELIDRLQVSAEQLASYINNILNVSRYDRNHLLLHLHEEDFISIVKDLLPDLALRAKTKKRRLDFTIPSDLPTIAADRSSLSEVLSNLIDNAIKYSHDNGEVLTTAAVRGDFIEITVQDQGIGMPAAVVENLFSKFYRSHKSKKQVNGTGLGLYICKAIVESHGGNIWARSTEGEGSTFGFTIPIYETVADKLGKDDNDNEQIIRQKDGWIKNHAMYRR